MPSLGPLEILVVMVVALLVFGPNKMPEVGRQVGRALHELRKFQETVRTELHDVVSGLDTPSTDAAAPPSLPPVVGPPGTGGPTATPPPAPHGAHAPSRFRAPNR